MSKRRNILGIIFAIFCIMLIAACNSVSSSDGEAIRMLLTPPDRASVSAAALLDSPENTVVLKLWTFHQYSEFEFWQELADAYREVNPRIKVEVEYISSDVYFNSTRLLSSFASGHGPDIFFVSPGTIQKFADAQIMQPLTDRFTESIRNDFDVAALDTVTVDQHIYAIPFETELLGLYYNEEMFASKGLAPPATWEEMAHAAAVLKTDEVSGLTLETYNGVYQLFNWLPFLWQTGADFITEDGYTELDPERTAQMYGFFRQMIQEQTINMNPSRPTNDIGIIANGETAMQVSGSWSIRMLETNYSEQPIRVVPLPVMEGSEPLTIAGGWKIAANRASEHAEDAADFIMWAFAGDPGIPLRWCTEVKFAYSPRKSVMAAADEIYQRGLRSVFTDQIYGTERQEPRLPQELNTIFSDGLQQLLYTQIPVSDIIAEQNSRIRTFLSDFEK